jgi:hypothetical protein
LLETSYGFRGSYLLLKQESEVRRSVPGKRCFPTSDYPEF